VPAGIDEAFEVALRGDFVPLLAARASASTADRIAIDAVVSLASDRPPPRAADARAHSARRALAPMALHAFLSADRRRLDEVLSAHDALGERREVASGWAALFDGKPIASEGGETDAANKVELAAQRAFAALEEGDIARAIELSRRATRMARTEGFVFLEYLASIVLARVRRYSGKPHLATRILAALAQVAPGPWRAFVQWERALTLDAVGRPMWSSTDALARMLDAASRGDRVGFEAAAEFRSGLRPLDRELEAVAAAIDPARARASIERWYNGEIAESPGEIAGFTGSSVDAEGEEHAGVLVLVSPDAPARRILRAGAGLLDRGARADVSYALAQARTYQLLAELAFAGPSGLDREVAFRRVYGFAFQPATHAGVLRTLVHRARSVIEGAADIARSDTRLSLVPVRAFVFPDPRCAQSIESLVLRSLALREGRASASEIAEALGVSARTVQTALKDLVLEGVCAVDGKGRAVSYKLEDTTFWEPTLDRMSPRGIL
jgi:hypothetical protein